jgi:signal peptide peptidase SppA
MQILDAALSSEWAIEESALDLILKIAAREHDVSPQALEAYRAKAMERAERAAIRDGVAILNVEGPLFKKANLMVEFSGATSYAILRRDLQAATDDARVKAILLNVDSPGGEVRGVAELANAIKAARGIKPIVAYVGDIGASAAYWLASAADKIVLGASAAVGSIGVIASIEDSRKLKEARGVRTHEFVSSQSPFKTADPDTVDGRDRIQARVNALADIFVDAIAANRDASRAYVLANFGKGDVLIGQAAIEAGMADEVGSFETTLAGLVRETDPLR